jgi:hypothetical protein
MAGLADLLGTSNPFQQFVASNRGKLGQIGAGLASGQNFAAGLSNAAQMQPIGAAADDAYAAGLKADAERQRSLNQTIEYMRGKGYDDLIAGVESGGMDMGAAWGEAMRRDRPTDGASAPSNVQEWQYYSQLTPEQQSQYLTMKRSNSPLNIGTGFVTQDMANPGQTIGAPIAINNEQEAFDKGFGNVTGTAAGEVAVLADSVSSKMPGLRSVVDTLSSLADTATYTQSGQAMDSVKRELGLPVGQGAIDRASYIAIVDNQVLPLLRDTFGAAFTEREGATLRATLGDANKSPAEKKAILNAFIAQKERDVAAMAGQSSGSGGYTVLGVE